MSAYVTKQGFECLSLTVYWALETISILLYYGVTLGAVVNGLIPKEG